MKFFLLICNLVLVSSAIALCAGLAEAAPSRDLGNSFNTGDVYALAFSPNGRILADTVPYIVPDTGTDRLPQPGGARLWDVASGKRIGFLQSEGIARGVAWSPDGRLLALGLEINGKKEELGVVKVWEVKTAKIVAQIAIAQGHVQSVIWTHDGTQIAAGCGDSRVRIWNWKSNKIVRVLQGPGNSLTSLALSPNGRLLAGGSLYAQDKSARLWNISTGRVLFTWKNQGQVTFSPDGRLVATASVEERKFAGSDALVRVWDASTGKIRYTLPSHDGERADSVAFAPKGLFLAANGLNPTRSWDLRRNKIVQTFPPYTFSGPIAFSPDGKLLAQGSGDSSTILFDVKVSQFNKR